MFRGRLMRNVIMPIFIIIVGIAMMWFGFHTINLEKDYIKTTGVITEIDINGSGDDTEYHVFVEYKIEGKRYNEELGTYASSYKVGKELDIRYNPEDYTMIDVAGNGVYIGLIIGGIVLMLLQILAVLRRLI